MAQITLVMPVYNAERHLPAVLAPQIAALEAGEVAELIAVDDGSTDASAARLRGRQAEGVSPTALRARILSRLRYEAPSFVASRAGRGTRPFVPARRRRSIGAVTRHTPGPKAARS